MRIREAKTGLMALKMDDEMWRMITKAFQLRVNLDWGSFETYECALAKEIAGKLWRRHQTGDLSLKLRTSEFHFLFCDAALCHVPESYHPQINLATEPFKRQTVLFKAVAIERL